METESTAQNLTYHKNLWASAGTGVWRLAANLWRRGVERKHSDAPQATLMRTILLYSRLSMSSAGALSVIAMCLVPSALHSQGKEPEFELPIYRCPGPPVLYTDAISAEEATRKSCRRIVGAPVSAESQGDAEKAKHLETCVVIADIGFDSVSRRQRGWSREEQISHYRKQFADSDAMIMINQILTEIYGGARKTTNASGYRKDLFSECKSSLVKPRKSGS
jgi:hypothetical protein